MDTKDKISFDKLSRMLGNEYFYDFPEAVMMIENPSEELLGIYIFNNPNYIKEINNPSKKLLMVAAEKGVVFNINDMDEDIQLAAVSSSSKNILDIKNPSEKVMWAAIKHYGSHYIKYRKDFSKEIKLSLIKNEHSVIQYEDDEDLQIEALKSINYVFEHIKNPSDKVKLAAISQNHNNFRDIKNPTEEMELKAIEKNSYNIEYINLENKNEDFFKKALERNGDIISNNKIPFKIRGEYIKKNPFLIKNINTKTDVVSRKLQTIVIKDHPEYITDLWHPTKTHIKIAIKQNPFLILHLLHKTDVNTIMFAIKESGYNINLIKKIPPDILNKFIEEIYDNSNIRDIIK